MATPARIRLENELRQQVDKAGAGFILLPSWPAKATYYAPDGRALPNLPADPSSMKRYLDRGLTLVPPANPIVTEAPAEFMCADCGKVCLSRIGLISHKRACAKKEEKQ